LAYLVATSQAHHRGTLASLFCQEAAAPTRTLRVLLSRIRGQLGTEMIVTEGDTVRFNRPAAQVDCLEFVRVLEGNLARQSLAQLEAAANLYRGEFLAGMGLPDSPEFEIWLLGQRSQMRHLYERGLAEIVARQMAQEAYEAAIQRAQQLLQSNSLLEEAHAQLIWLYAQTGRREAALGQFELCRELLWRELAVEPTPELSALVAAVLSGRPAAAFKVTPATLVATTLPQAPDFVGRETELGQLQAAWQAALDGRGSVVLVAAEAGGGKSRLVQEFGRLLPAGSFLVGHCYESTTALPYHPWTEVLEARLGALDDASLKRLSPFVQEYLARLAPGLAQRLGRRLPQTPPTGSGELEHLFAAISEFLFQLPGRSEAASPSLIFIDDLQWAGEMSLRLFHTVARRAGQARLLLVGAYRSEEAEDAPGLPTLLSDLQRLASHRLALRPLPPAAVSALAEQLWPKLPEGYRSHVAAMLAQATGGNPLFVTEVLRELAHATQLPAELPVPATIRDLIRRRLSQLPETSRQVIEAMAVLDSPATLDEAQQTSGRSDDEVALAIDLGLRRGLLQTQTDNHLVRYDFKHDLIQQAVVSQLSHVRQSLLHRRVANMLAQIAARLAPQQRQAIAGRITRHALEGESFQLVFQWAPLAAAHASRLYAYSDALQALEAASQAFDQLHRYPGFDLAAGERRLIEILLNRAALIPHVAGPPPEELGQLVQQATDLLARYPDERLQAMSYLRQSEYLVASNAYERAAEVALAAARQYLDLGDRCGAAAGLSQAGSCKITISQNKTGRRYYEEALKLYQAEGDVAGESRCLSGLAWCELNLGEVEFALTHLTRALEISEQQADRLGQARTNYTLAAAWDFYYDAEKVRDFAQKSARIYRDMGHSLTEQRPLFYLGVAHHIAGELVQAQAMYEQVFREANAYDDHWLAGWTAQLLGRLALGRGDMAGAARWLGYAAQSRQESGELSNIISDLAWLGRLSLALGQVIVALEHTGRAMAELEKVQGEVYVWEMPDVFMCHAEALAANGRQAEARVAVQRAYDTLMGFSKQIQDPRVKERFLSYRTNGRIISTWQTGKIAPLSV
ncbi:MAG: AAA family ATPase, partial [Chloroflexi bacterium]|nr:AAA family ATPase [Chloroflexota bacterium]